ncbi:DUF11 domain-containing protein [Candidatus Woesearchaeota archaeon]|nr:DUF11 domain-containing protein [Candidatus Woesearchaeota archaeon]
MTNVTQGSQVYYRILLDNVGNGDAIDITIADLLPPYTSYNSSSPPAGFYNATAVAWFVPILPRRTAGYIDLFLDVSPNATIGFDLINVVGISYDVSGVPVTRFAIAPPITVLSNITPPPPPPPPPPGFMLNKTTNMTTVRQGGQVTYQILLNFTTSFGIDIVAVDTLPPSTSYNRSEPAALSFNATHVVFPTIFFMSPGETLLMNLTLDVHRNATINASLINEVNVSFNNGLANVSAIAYTTLQPITVLPHLRPNLLLSKVTSMSETRQGGIVDYQIRLTNIGQDATNVVVTDIFPQGTRYGGSSPFSYNYNDTQAEIIIPFIPIASVYEINISLKVTPNATPGSSLINNARVLYYNGTEDVTKTANSSGQPIFIAPTPFPPAPSYALTCGDCDGSGFVDVLDSYKAAKYAVGSATLDDSQFRACNVQGARGSRYNPYADVTTLDALTIAQYVVGRIPSLTCAEEEKVVFYSQREPSHSEIYTMNKDGTNEQPVRFNGSLQSTDSHPSLSPDGQWIVFQTDRDAATPFYPDTIYRVPTNNTDPNYEPEQLTTLPFHDTSPVWSPTGDDIAFVSENRIPQGIYVLDLRTRAINFVIAGNQPAWSPDGRQIVYTKGFNGIYKIDKDGMNDQELTHIPTEYLTPFLPRSERHPHWGRNGKITFIRSDPRCLPAGCRDTNQVWMMDSDGSDQQQITYLGTGADNPAWMRDSNSILFHGDQQGGANLSIRKVVSFPGGIVTELTSQAPLFSTDRDAMQ